LLFLGVSLRAGPCAARFSLGPDGLNRCET
jgi:hypothetical protein